MGDRPYGAQEMHAFVASNFCIVSERLPIYVILPWSVKDFQLRRNVITYKHEIRTTTSQIF